jgi:hypothetical protein
MGCENPEALRTLSNLIIELTSDPENNALFNSGPLSKPVFYVYGIILLFYVIIVYK